MNAKLTRWACVLLPVALCHGLTHAETAMAAPPLRAPVLARCELDYPPYCNCSVTPGHQAHGFSVELLLAALQAVGREATFKTAPWAVPKQDLADGQGKEPSGAGSRAIAHILMAAIVSLLLLLGGAFLWSRMLQRRVAHRTRVIAFKNALLQAQSDASIEGILVVDEQNRIVSHNRRFAEMWGIPSDLIDKGDDAPVLRCVTDQVTDPQQFLEHVQHLYQHRQEVSRDELMLKDGRTFDRYSAPVVGAADHYYGRVWYFRDITDHRRTEQALRESEAEYRSLFENSVMGISEALPDGRLIRANTAYAKMYGYDSPAQMLSAVTDVGKQLYANREDRQAALRILSEKGVMEPREFQVIRRDGTRFDVMASAREIRDSAGRLICYQAAHVDITERKQAEAALRESEEKYRLLVDQAREAVYVVQQGVIMFANSAFARMTGLDASAIVGMSMDAFVTQSDRAEVWEHHRRFIAGGADDKPFEIQVQLQGGVMRWVSINTTPITWRGSPATLNLAADITERKQSAAEHERLMAAIEQSGEVIVITASDGTIQFVNPAFERITGFSRIEAIGQNPRILKSGLQDAAFYRELWATITSGRTWKGRFANRRKDGTLYTEEATISPVLNAAGEIVNYVAVKRDITEHLRLESQFLQAQKMESVGRLAGGVAHDFNNLLMGIMGYTEMCRYHVEPGHPIRAMLDEITTAAQRSAAITRQLLAFARKQTIAPVVLDLNDAVSGMLKLLRQLIGEDIDLIWLPGSGTLQVKMDPAQIDQILANLAVNARDAIGGVGKLTLVSGIATFDASHDAGQAPFGTGTYVMLAVSDNGCGMDKATSEHIFEPFFTTKGVGKGTGLGLATVYGIVKQNNGFVNVQSEPGKGTTFRIYLPLHDDARTPASNAKDAAACPHGTETVLVVEDEKSVRSSIQAFLKSFGYTVLTAASPEQALPLAAAHPGRIDLLLTDVVMPGMSGRDLTQQLKAQRPEVRCIFMSGYTFDVIATRGLLETDVDFLSKPFSRSQLARKVREVLDSPVGRTRDL